MSQPAPDPNADRRVLRQRLIARRQAFVAEADPQASLALASHLGRVLLELEPECLGLYWPVRSEFNPASVFDREPSLRTTPQALPYCRREPREMHYRAWDGQAPRAQDECRIATSDGRLVAPDVIVAPCVGYTRQGYRLGYGGGYFDRYLAAHPAATVVGVAFACCELAPDEYEPQPYDLPMLMIVTEQGVVSP